MLQIPFLLVFCFSILFYYLKGSFISGLTVFAMAFASNMAIGKYASVLQRRYMKFKDQRVKALTESLNNIRMLKLYSWGDIFKHLIKEKRIPELGMLRKRYNLSIINISTLYFFPSILSAVIFSFYIGFGNTLSLDIAFTVMTILNLIKEPLRSLPQFIGQLLEFQVSMTRIQEFIQVDEINTSMVNQVSGRSTSASVAISPGTNFHWG